MNMTETRIDPNELYALVEAGQALRTHNTHAAGVMVPGSEDGDALLGGIETLLGRKHVSPE